MVGAEAGSSRLASVIRSFVAELGHSAGRAAPSRARGEPGLRTSLVHTVYAAILDALDQGMLRPGDRIVASDLAQRMGLSRAPVREALAMLAGQGVVELHPDRGAVLRALTLGDLAAIYEVRGPVAAVGVRAAAARIEEGDHAAQVRAAMGRVRTAGEQPLPGIGLYSALDAYHARLNAIGERPHVDFVLRAVNLDYGNRYLVQAIDLNRHARRHVENYQRLTDAVLAGDGAAGEAILRHHCDWCVRLLIGDDPHAC